MKRALLAVLLALTVRAACADDAGLFVAVGYGGRRITSRDGFMWKDDQRWSDGSKEDDDVLSDVAFGAGRFIAVGGGPRTGHILATRDGRDWRSLQDVKGCVATIAFGNGRFVAGHDAELMSSTTGEKFETGQRLDWQGNVHPRRSACGDTEAGFRFVIIGQVDLWAEKQRVSWRGVTGDGKHWEHAEMGTNAAADIAYGSGHFVVVGPGSIESSHDGQTWVRRVEDPGNYFTRVVWTGQRFIVPGPTKWSSPDGITWTRMAPSEVVGALDWAREGDGVFGLHLLYSVEFFVTHDLKKWVKGTIPPGPPLTAVTFGKP